MSRFSEDDLKKAGVLDPELRKRLLSITEAEAKCSGELWDHCAVEARRMLPHFLTNFGTPKDYRDLVTLSHYMVQAGVVTAVSDKLVTLAKKGRVTDEEIAQREANALTRAEKGKALFGSGQTNSRAGAYL